MPHSQKDLVAKRQATEGRNFETGAFGMYAALRNAHFEKESCDNMANEVGLLSGV